MKSRKAKINKTFVEKITPEYGEFIFDTEIQGFYIRNGVRGITFCFRRYKNGVVTKKTFGKYPDMKVDEARAEAQRMTSAISNFENIDSPIAHRQPLVGEIIDHYIEQSKQKANATSILRHWDHLRKKKMVEISRGDILAVRDVLKDHPSSANLAIKYLSSAIGKMVRDTGISLPNPAAGIPKYHVEPRKRFLSEAEAPKLMAELKKMSESKMYDSQADALLMMIYTGQRKTNVLTMTLADIDRGVWTIPYNKSKSGREIVVPLNEFAMDIVNKRAPMALDGFLFHRNGKVLADARKTFLTACKAANVKDCHIHDLRRTLGSWMLMSGTPIEVVSRTLGHSSIRVTEQVYAHMLPKKISTATNAAVEAMLKGKV